MDKRFCGPFGRSDIPYNYRMAHRQESHERRGTVKDKYKYLVAFAHTTGFGSTVITYKKKISSERDADLISKFIEASNHVESVSILNFILLDTKWGFWEWLSAIAEQALLVFCILALIASFFV